jgi:REP element-mobilizing transposase RayT
MSVARSETKPINGLRRGPLGAIIGVDKMSVTRLIEAELNGANIWQCNYYKHIIRDNVENGRIKFYIESNPIKWAEDKENSEKKK